MHRFLLMLCFQREIYSEKYYAQESADFPFEIAMNRFNLRLPVCLLTISSASDGMTNRGMRITEAGSVTRKSRK